MRLKQKGILGSEELEVMAVRFSNDDKKVAGCYADGTLKVFLKDSGIKI